MSDSYHNDSYDEVDHSSSPSPSPSSSHNGVTLSVDTGEDDDSHMHHHLTHLDPHDDQQSTAGDNESHSSGSQHGGSSSSPHTTTTTSSQKPRRVPFTEAQINVLNQAFAQGHYIDKEVGLHIAGATGLQEKQVREWFNNSRKQLHRQEMKEISRAIYSSISQSPQPPRVFNAPQSSITPIRDYKEIKRMHTSAANTASHCATSTGSKFLLPAVTTHPQKIAGAGLYQWRRPARQLCFLCKQEGVGLRYCEYCPKFYHERCVEEMEQCQHKQQQLHRSSMQVDGSDLDTTFDEEHDIDTSTMQRIGGTDPAASSGHTSQTIPQLPSIHQQPISTITTWRCPWHRCFTCQTSTLPQTNAAGMRQAPTAFSWNCIGCPRTFCQQHYNDNTRALPLSCIVDTHQYRDTQTYASNAPAQHKRNLETWQQACNEHGPYILSMMHELKWSGYSTEGCTMVICNDCATADAADVLRSREEATVRTIMFSSGKLRDTAPVQVAKRKRADSYAAPLVASKARTSTSNAHPSSSTSSALVTATASEQQSSSFLFTLDYFHKVLEVNEQGRQAIVGYVCVIPGCTRKGQRYSAMASGYGSLSSHLRASHPEEYEKYRQLTDEKKAARAAKNVKHIGTPPPASSSTSAANYNSLSNSSLFSTPTLTAVNSHTTADPQTAATPLSSLPLPDINNVE